MKKFFCTLLLVMIFAGTSFALEINSTHRVGILANLNTTQETFQTFAEDFWGKSNRIFTLGSTEPPVYIPFNSLNEMLLAVESGKVDEISLPEAVADYIINTNKKYAVSCIMRSVPVYLSLGFRENDERGLKEKFNEALKAIHSDKTLLSLIEKYIDNAGADKIESVKFEKFADADTIKIAVTGDMPPASD